MVGLIIYSIMVIVSVVFLTLKQCVTEREVTLTDAIEILILSAILIGFGIFLMTLFLWSCDKFNHAANKLTERTDKIILWKKKWQQ